MRVSCSSTIRAIAATGMCGANSKNNASNKSVNPEPGRAHGSWTWRIGVKYSRTCPHHDARSDGAGAVVTDQQSRAGRKTGHGQGSRSGSGAHGGLLAGSQPQPGWDHALDCTHGQVAAASTEQRWWRSSESPQTCSLKVPIRVASPDWAGLLRGWWSLTTHQFEGAPSLMLTREDDIDVHALRRQGWTISAIARTSVGTVRRSERIWPVGRPGSGRVAARIRSRCSLRTAGSG